MSAPAERDMSLAEIEAAVADARAARARGVADLLLALAMRFAAALRTGQAKRAARPWISLATRKSGA